MPPPGRDTWRGLFTFYSPRRAPVLSSAGFPISEPQLSHDLSSEPSGQRITGEWSWIVCSKPGGRCGPQSPAGRPPGWRRRQLSKHTGHGPSCPVGCSGSSSTSAATRREPFRTSTPWLEGLCPRALEVPAITCVMAPLSHTPGRIRFWAGRELFTPKANSVVD